jgi:plasmid stabilization system protein ParE
VRVELRREAYEQVLARQAWWVENRPAARTAFADELAAALLDLAEHPMITPVVLVRDGIEIRRWLMPGTRCHLYYAADEARGVVDVLAAWGARMGRLPPLAKATR